MKQYRYLVIGGNVRSKDGDRHYISAYDLVRLYGVNPAECIMTRRGDEESALRGISPGERSRLIRLFPRHDGNYSGCVSTSVA